jgi:alpha-mannosidase
LGVKKDKSKSEPVAIVANTFPWPRNEMVALPTEEIEGVLVSESKVQPVLGNAGAFGVGFMESIQERKVLQRPATSNSFFIVLIIVTEKEDGIFILGNGKIEATIQGGQILSLLDVELNREIIVPGKRANRLLIYDDQPLYWDAWDVELYHLEEHRELGPGTTKIVDRGPYRVGLLVTHKISDESWIKTTITLDADDSPIHNYADGFKDPLTYLRFDCEVEWHENRRFLKVEFPVDIYSDTVFILFN